MRTCMLEMRLKLYAIYFDVSKCVTQLEADKSKLGIALNELFA